MEQENPQENCAPANSPKKHRHVFNADFMFVLITAAALQGYALMYSYLFLG